MTGNYPPPPPLRGTTPVSGVESVTTENTAPANCPPETGRTSEAEGVDKSPYEHKTENPQTLAITGVPADDVLLQNR